MAHVTRRRTAELLRKLFEILIPQPDGLQARDALKELQQRIDLTEYEKGTYESGGSRFEQIVRFATVDCVKAGWLVKQKGRWSITEEGKQAYTALSDPEVFYREAVKLYKKWRATQPDTEPAQTNATEDETSGKAASITFEQAEEQAWSEIEQYLRGMNPYDSARDHRVKVQVKRVSQNVTVDGLRSFMALLGDDDVGLFVTTSRVHQGRAGRGAYAGETESNVGGS